MADKLLTDYTHFTDDELDAIGASGKKGLTGNTNVTIVAADLSAFDNAVDGYHTAKGAVRTGGTAATAAKNAAKVLLQAECKRIAQICNLQTTDATKLSSTGLPLAKHAGSVNLPLPTGLEVYKVRNTNAGDMHAQVDKPAVSDHGTVFAIQEITTATGSDNPDDWTHVSINGHSTTLHLNAGSRYRIAAAYKGKDGDELTWCPFITIMAS